MPPAAPATPQVRDSTATHETSQSLDSQQLFCEPLFHSQALQQARRLKPANAAQQVCIAPFSTSQLPWQMRGSSFPSQLATEVA